MFPPLALPRSGMVDSNQSPLSQVHLAPEINYKRVVNLSKNYSYN